MPCCSICHCARQTLPIKKTLKGKPRRFLALSRRTFDDKSCVQRSRCLFVNGLPRSSHCPAAFALFRVGNCDSASVQRRGAGRHRYLQGSGWRALVKSNAARHRCHGPRAQRGRDFPHPAQRGSHGFQAEDCQEVGFTTRGRVMSGHASVALAATLPNLIAKVTKAASQAGYFRTLSWRRGGF